MDKPDKQPLREWLTKCKTLQTQDLVTYIRGSRENQSLINALYSVLNTQEDDEINDTICSQLYELYRTRDTELKRFCLQFAPTLIWCCLLNSSCQKKQGKVEMLLLGIYNMEVVNPDGSPKVSSFTMPTLAKPSIYHEPLQLSALGLTESALSSYQKTEPEVVSSRPYPTVDTFKASNRSSVLSYILNCYNKDIGYMPATSHQQLCQMCSRVSIMGFPRDSGTLAASPSSPPPPKRRPQDGQPQRRIPLKSDLLLEMLDAVYFVMFNGLATSGEETLENIHYRASRELMADVLLVTNAIRNSLASNPSGRPKDGPIGVMVSVSNPCSAKLITNAAFQRRKKEEASKATAVDNDFPMPDDWNEDDPQEGCSFTASTGQVAVNVVVGGKGSGVTQVDSVALVPLRLSASNIELTVNPLGQLTNHGSDGSGPAANQSRVLLSPASHLKDTIFAKPPTQTFKRAPTAQVSEAETHI